MYESQPLHKCKNNASSETGVLQGKLQPCHADGQPNDFDGSQWILLEPDMKLDKAMQWVIFGGNLKSWS